MFDFVVSSPWKLVLRLNDVRQQKGPVLSEWIQDQVGEAIVFRDVCNDQYLTTRIGM